MNFLAKTYQLLALTVNFIAGGLLLISVYSYLIPPDRFSLPYFFTVPRILFYRNTITSANLHTAEEVCPPTDCFLIALVSSGSKLFSHPF